MPVINVCQFEFGERKEAEGKVMSEFNTDYSGADDIEMIKVEASRPSKAEKSKVWTRYQKPGSYKQQEIIASAPCFYN